MRSVYRLNDIENNLRIMRCRPLDILVVGGTGTGKSSTLNAIFEDEISRVGRGCDPETMQISSNKLNDKMRFWDTPGFGDGKEQDAGYAEQLKQTLYREYELDNTKYGMIDVVLVIVDGSGRDMGTAYRILNEVILPDFPPNRIITAINQADMAMKGRHWNYEENRPDRILAEFLEEKAGSIKKRVMESTGVRIADPVCYSAEKNYNIEKLLDLIIDNMPTERRRITR